jgi:cytochrome P450
VARILEQPAVLARLRAELAQVVGNGALAPDHLPRLEYLDATIKETLRLDPIIPDVARRLERPLRVGGWTLPAGVHVAPCIYLAHRRAASWPEPDRFLPERFLGLRPSPYEFLPFGGGDRRCLGMAFAMSEMRIVLAEVLRRTELRIAPGYRGGMERRSVTLAPARGLPVVLQRVIGPGAADMLHGFEPGV